MSDIDVRTGGGTSRSGAPTQKKVQIEQQQFEQRAEHKESKHFWHEIQYPATKASPAEWVMGAVAFVLVFFAIWRVFYIPEYQKTQFDNFLTFALYFFLCFVFISGGLFLFTWIKRKWQETQMYILPNGFPIMLDTIRRNYLGFDDRIFQQLGYFNVENTRAGNAIVAPGEITNTDSHASEIMYAPSNTGGGYGSNDSEDEPLLKQLLDNKIREVLPKRVELFDIVDQRKDGHVILGVDGSNTIIQASIDDIFHHMIGGQSGRGKSVYMRSLAYQLLCEAQEDKMIELGFADIENNTFPEFKGRAGVEWYAGTYLEVDALATSMLREVERRKNLYDEFDPKTPKTVHRYNEMAQREGKEELTTIILFFDEFAATLNKLNSQYKRISANVMELALRARKYGIFLVIGSNTFKADKIDTSILGQLGFRTSFGVRNYHESIQVLGEAGAEDLQQDGEALIKTKAKELIRVQTPYVDDDQLYTALEQFAVEDTNVSIPDLVREMIEYAREELDNKLLIDKLYKWFSQSGVSRGDIIEGLEWMDHNGYTERGSKNARILKEK